MRSVLKPISPSIRTLSTIRSVSDWTASLKGFVVIRTDHLDARRASQLQSTLPTRSWKGGLCSTKAQEGDALPPAHHLVYFQPDSSFDELGLDGSSTEYNAPAPYLRRMWAGGSFEWRMRKKLVIGERSTEHTRVPEVELKKDMIFVNQGKRYYNGHDTGNAWAVKETRTHVFRTDDQVKAVKPIDGSIQLPQRKADYTFSYTPSSPLLFRYSALTFNGHKIHYDRDWTRDVEGHPDLVVHGPLTSTLLVELASHIALEQKKRLVRFDYRATSPMYVEREVNLRAIVGLEGKLELLAEQEGRVGMKATALLK